MKPTTARALPLIIIAQFFCTSLWFGGNAVLADLGSDLQLPSSALVSITSFVQVGFIAGTFLYALLTIADRFAPSKVFLCSAIAASIANALIVFSSEYATILLCRFCTGFFLAGIYPVGMKIAADHYEKGLSKALGLLVGALVLGTAFPHLLKSLSLSLSWKTVLLTISAMAMIGGLMIGFLVPEGPYRKKMQRPNFNAIIKVFRPKLFRSAAFGYFGHMWELYTFWAFLPLILTTYNKLNDATLPVSFWCFVVVGIGSLSCALAGFISINFPARTIALVALAASGICCIISPLAFDFSETIFIIFLLLWGFMVVADSPMLSSVMAENANQEEKGTALTISTCIGFFITIISIALLHMLEAALTGKWLYIFLSPGPLLGFLSLSLYKKKEPSASHTL